MITEIAAQEHDSIGNPISTTDFAGELHSALEGLGERFGVYDVMSLSGPLTPDCLATQVEISEDCARVWLEIQAAGSYLEHGHETNLYSLWCNWPGRGLKVPDRTRYRS